MEPIDFQKQFAKQCRKAERHLSAACPKLASWIHQCGKCTLEPQWTREPFAALVRAIAHQQLHGKAAESILGRLISSFPGQAFPTATQLASLRSPKLRSMGFSEAKTLAIRGVAKETLSGVIPDREVSRQLSDEELIARLIPLRGIGQWTVEMFLIFTLGRLDVMPADDFGIKSGLRHLYGLEGMPKKQDFRRLTDSWRPFRSVGAWYLWRLADAKKEA